MTTPDTTTETDERVIEALAHYAQYAPYPDNTAQEMFDDLEPILAEIRRQAAADALRRKAKGFDNTARMFRDMSRKPGIDHESSTIYWVHANQARTDADALRKEADGIIAEGYEWQCASGSGCCAPVPDAGDMCPECDAAEYDDRWAE